LAYAADSIDIVANLAVWFTCKKKGSVPFKNRGQTTFSQSKRKKGPGSN